MEMNVPLKMAQLKSPSVSEMDDSLFQESITDTLEQRGITEEDLFDARDKLHSAIDYQKRGKSYGDLWDAMMSACKLDGGGVNYLVREHSDALAQGYPNLDMYDYVDFIETKVKEHEYLLHALYDGACFTNRKIDSDTYTTLFGNAERLAGVEAVARFLENGYLSRMIESAGDHVELDKTSECEEEANGIDRFLAVVDDSPERLAEMIRRDCQGMTNVKDEESNYRNIQALFEMASGMFSAVRVKRHDLKMRYNRERLPLGSDQRDWLADGCFHEMWDGLLYVSTVTLKKATQSGFHHPIGKPLAMLSIRIGQLYCDALEGSLQAEVPEDTKEHSHAALIRDVLDPYATAIVNACFGRDQQRKADDDVYKQLMALCQSGFCYSAMYMLLYVCLEDMKQLYKLMIEWRPLETDSDELDFASAVFKRWMDEGTSVDMEHLLKGPEALDVRLADCLESCNRSNLAAIIRMRMGDTAGAQDVIQLKNGPLTGGDVAHLYLLTCCERNKVYEWSVSYVETRQKYYLQAKLEGICRRFNFIGIAKDTTPVLQELLYMMNHSPSYPLIRSALDIFMYEHKDFIPQRPGEWRGMWQALARYMCVDPDAYIGQPRYYGNTDFLILQSACDKLKLLRTEREEIYQEMHSELYKRFAESNEIVPEYVKTMLLFALDINGGIGS